MSRTTKSLSRDIKSSNEPGNSNGNNTKSSDDPGNSDDKKRTTTPPKNIPDNGLTEQANSRVRKLETIDDMVKRISNKLDKKINVVQEDGGDTDLEELREQNFYARNNYVNIEDDEKFKPKIIKCEESPTSPKTVQEKTTPKQAEAGKSRVLINGPITKSRVMGRKPIVKI